MQERRRYKRQVLVMCLHVFDRDSGRVLGYLADISQHGLMLIGEQPLPPGEIFNLGIRVYQLKADLHYVSSSEEAHIPCVAECRWTHPVDSELHGSGLMIQSFGAGGEALLKNLIERIGREDDPAHDRHVFWDALIHLDSTPSPGQQEEIGAQLIQQNGVVSVMFQPDTPHLMVVQYNREKTTPENLVTFLQRRDVHCGVVKVEG